MRFDLPVEKDNKIIPFSKIYFFYHDIGDSHPDKKGVRKLLKLKETLQLKPFLPIATRLKRMRNKKSYFLKQIKHYEKLGVNAIYDARGFDDKPIILLRDESVRTVFNKKAVRYFIYSGNNRCLALFFLGEKGLKRERIEIIPCVLGVRTLGLGDIFIKAPSYTLWNNIPSTKINKVLDTIRLKPLIGSPIVSAILFYKGKILIQIRSKTDKGGSLKDFSTSGHVEEFENPNAAIIREIREELNSSAALKPVGSVLVEYVKPDGKPTKHLHYFYVGLLKKKPKKSREADTLLFLKPKELILDLMRNPSAYTPDFKKVFETFKEFIFDECAQTTKLKK